MSVESGPGLQVFYNRERTYPHTSNLCCPVIDYLRHSQDRIDDRLSGVVVHSDGVFRVFCGGNYS